MPNFLLYVAVFNFSPRYEIIIETGMKSEAANGISDTAPISKDEFIEKYEKAKIFSYKNIKNIIVRIEFVFLWQESDSDKIASKRGMKTLISKTHFEAVAVIFSFMSIAIAIWSGTHKNNNVKQTAKLTEPIISINKLFFFILLQ